MAIAVIRVNSADQDAAGWMRLGELRVKWLKTALGGLFLAWLIGCAAAGLPAQELNFAKDPADRPVIASGVAGWPAFPADPAVIRDEEGYHLFFTNIFVPHGGSTPVFWTQAT